LSGGCEVNAKKAIDASLNERCQESLDLGEEGPDQEVEGELEEKIIKTILYDDWEQVLILMTQDMDPWDIDIVKLSEKFTKYIKVIHSRNLRVPARIILASSIIYRMKCEVLPIWESEEKDEENNEDLDKEEFIEAGPEIKIPPLYLPVKREVKRKITLDELVEALNKAMKVRKKRIMRQIVVLEMNQKNFTEHMEKFYEKILEILESEGLIFFSEFEKNKRKEEIIRDFASLLQLMKDKKIVCEQKELFDEILIKKVEAS